jgi:hypothetical protein
MFMLILEVEEENLVRVKNQSKSGRCTKGGAKAGQKFAKIRITSIGERFAKAEPV